MKWEPNPNFAQLPAISAGDIVHLRYNDGFNYIVKAIVSRVSFDEIEARIEAMFDGAGQGQLTAGEPLNLVGETVSFNSKAVHKVIRRNDGA